jgi:hypothetical protein
VYRIKKVKNQPRSKGLYRKRERERNFVGAERCISASFAILTVHVIFLGKLNEGK